MRRRPLKENRAKLKLRFERTKTYENGARFFGSSGNPQGDIKPLAPHLRERRSVSAFEWKQQEIKSMRETCSARGRTNLRNKPPGKSSDAWAYSPRIGGMRPPSAVHTRTQCCQLYSLAERSHRSPGAHSRAAERPWTGSLIFALPAKREERFEQNADKERRRFRGKNRVEDVLVTPPFRSVPPPPCTNCNHVLQQSQVLPLYHGLLKFLLLLRCATLTQTGHSAVAPLAAAAAMKGVLGLIISAF